MLDYRTLYRMMRRYYDPRNSTSRLYYTHTTGTAGPSGSPGSRHMGGSSSAFGRNSRVRFHFATVTDNKDPDGWGRIRVQFPQYGDDFVSDWSPIVRPFAGADRGLFSLPEIDETVLCAFLGDRPTKPIILGSVYTRQNPNPLGENPGNDLKVLMTKSKMRLELNDKEGEESITLFMKEGKMRVVLKKDMGMEIINELGDINVKCKKLIIESGDTAELLFQKNFSVTADEISLEGNKSLVSKAGGNVKLKGQAIELKGSAGVTAENKQIAAKGDIVVGIDTHIEMVPSGSGTTPVPIPNPYIGKLVDKLSTDVKVKGNYAATKGSISKGIGPGHILFPPGVSWQKAPSNKGEVALGTVPSVKINNKEAAVLGSTVKTCADPADAPNCKIIAIGVPIKIPVMVPGMDPVQFARDGGTVINTRDPIADPDASNERDYALQNPRWSASSGKCGEEVELEVTCQNMQDNASVYFQIWHEGANRETDAPVKEITGYVEGGSAKVDWTYFLPLDDDEPLTAKPKFIFTVKAFRCTEVESSVIEMSADYDVKVCDLAGIIYKNTQCKIIASDGEEKSATTDEQGILQVRDITPGNFEIQPQLRDEEGSEISLYAVYEVQYGDTLENIIEDYKLSRLFDAAVKLSIDPALDAATVWSDQKNISPGAICFAIYMSKEGKNDRDMRIFPGEFVHLPYKGLRIEVR